MSNRKTMNIGGIIVVGALVYLIVRPKLPENDLLRLTIETWGAIGHQGRVAACAKYGIIYDGYRGWIDPYTGEGTYELGITNELAWCQEIARRVAKEAGWPLR